MNTTTLVHESFMRLVASRGLELGARTEALPGLQSSLALWTQTEGGFALRSIVEFPSQLGAVTSGALVSVGTQKVLLIGHESGFVSLWQKTRWSLAWLGQTDVRSPSPVPSPYALRHIRAVVPWKDSLVLVGSEDGDVTQLRLRLVAHGVDAVVIHRARHSPTAQRGINGMALLGDLLAVTSCTFSMCRARRCSFWLQAACV